MFPDEAAAERWFIRTRWPNGVAWPRCGSVRASNPDQPTRKPQPYRCRDCRRDFSIRTGTVMECSNVKLRRSAVAFFLILTESKGRSSLKLAADLGVTQRTAWHTCCTGFVKPGGTARDRCSAFPGTVETDETFVGGRRWNMHAEKRARLTGRGTATAASDVSTLPYVFDERVPSGSRAADPPCASQRSLSGHRELFFDLHVPF